MRLVTTNNLHWQTAITGARAAVDRAGTLGIAINVAVVDGAGTPLAFLRMNGAPLHSIGIAEDKAYTAAGFALSTAEWDRVVGDDENLRRGLAARPRLVMFGGGLPVVADGACVGGIGVSGGSEEQDGDCARAGLEAMQAHT